MNMTVDETNIENKYLAIIKSVKNKMHLIHRFNSHSNWRTVWKEQLVIIIIFLLGSKYCVRNTFNTNTYKTKGFTNI